VGAGRPARRHGPRDAAARARVLRARAAVGAHRIGRPLPRRAASKPRRPAGKPRAAAPPRGDDVAAPRASASRAAPRRRPAKRRCGSTPIAHGPRPGCACGCSRSAHACPPGSTPASTDYARRLSAHWKIRAARNRTRPSQRFAAGAARASRRKAPARARGAAPGEFAIALDERGIAMTTRELADAAWRASATADDVALLIGGADGLPPRCAPLRRELVAVEADAAARPRARAACRAAVSRAEPAR
jgi:23S rRNA pseudoU1915 N3-methylase RlmH